jgi:hypothetical protein
MARKPIGCRGKRLPGPYRTGTPPDGGSKAISEILSVRSRIWGLRGKAGPGASGEGANLNVTSTRPLVLAFPHAPQSAPRGLSITNSHVPSGWRRTTSTFFPVNVTGLPSGPLVVALHVPRDMARFPSALWIALILGRGRAARAERARVLSGMNPLPAALVANTPARKQAPLFTSSVVPRHGMYRSSESYLRPIMGDAKEIDEARRGSEERTIATTLMTSPERREKFETSSAISARDPFGVRLDDQHLTLRELILLRRQARLLQGLDRDDDVDHHAAEPFGVKQRVARVAHQRRKRLVDPLDPPRGGGSRRTIEPLLMQNECASVRTPVHHGHVSPRGKSVQKT